MPARNEPCPCGSDTKYKRCCLVRSEAVTRELRDRGALLEHVVEWLKAEHHATLDDAHRETTLIRMLRGRAGRNMSQVWALNDFTPADGGPPLMARFAARAELEPRALDIARGLAEARLDVYAVRGATPGVEIQSLTSGARVRLLHERGLTDLETGEILVARIVHNTSAPTLWGLAFRFARASARRWNARLLELPEDRGAAALALLHFHPDDAAEPLPDGLELLSITWMIDEDEAVLEVLEDDPLLECIGEAMPDGWTFSWLTDATTGRPDLGGWQEDDGDIEVARAVVREHEVTLTSADRGTLLMVAAHLEARLSGSLAHRADPSPPDPPPHAGRGFHARQDRTAAATHGAR